MALFSVDCVVHRDHVHKAMYIFGAVFWVRNISAIVKSAIFTIYTYINKHHGKDKM